MDEMDEQDSTASRDATAPDAQPDDEARRLHRSRAIISLLTLVVSAALLLGIVLAARGAPGGVRSGGGATTVSGAHASSQTPVAPDFTLTTLNGATYHLASQRGHVVVLYFMSTTCTECVRGTYFIATAMQEIASPKAEAISIDMNPGNCSGGLAPVG